MNIRFMSVVAFFCLCPCLVASEVTAGDVDELCQLRLRCAALEQKNEGLEGRLKDESTEFDMWCHEIANCFNIVCGAVDLVRTAQVSPGGGESLGSVLSFSEAQEIDIEQVKKFLDEYQLDKTIADARKLFEDMRGWRQMKRGVFALRPEVFSLKDDVVRYFAQTVKIFSKGKPVEFRVDFGRSLPLNFVGDASKLRLALVNLISNAYKFTDHGSVVVRIRELKGDFRPKGQGDVDSKMWVAFHVKDTGMGMSEPDLLRASVEYFQVNSAELQGGRGQGLGLSIVKQIAESWGGMLELNSSVGVGTTISFIVPLEVAPLLVRSTVHDEDDE